MGLRVKKDLLPQLRLGTPSLIELVNVWCLLFGERQVGLHREPGNWVKVYEDGYSNGRRVSVHYFRSRSGQIFDLDVKPNWSNVGR